MRVLRNLLKIRILFSLFVLGAVVMGISSLFLTTQIQPSSKRKIASSEIHSWLDENAPYDLSAYSGAELALRGKIRLAQKAELQKNEEGNLTLNLPAFLVRDESGEEKNICEVLPYLEFLLEADGLLINGDAVQILVRSQCQIFSENPEMLEPIPVPMDVLSQKQEHKDRNGYYLKKPNGADLPKNWFVRSLQMYSIKNKSNLIKLNSVEIREVTNRDLSIEL